MTDSPKRDTLISKRENQAMFNAIAHRYDLMNRLISLGRDAHWRRLAIDELRPRPHGRYLDVGSGTGDLAIDVEYRAPGSTVTGLDPSLGMLHIGSQKVSGSGKGIRFVAGDAMYLPFGDARFDGVILGFCIRNVEDRTAAVAEFHRVLKPGGRLVILELTVPTNPVFSLGHLIYTSTIIPLIANILTQKGAYNYLVKSVRAFPRAQHFLEKMISVGFVRGHMVPLMLGSVTIFVCEK